MEEYGGFSVNYGKLSCSEGNLRVPDAEVALDRRDHDVRFECREMEVWVRMLYWMIVLWGRRCYEHLPGRVLAIGCFGYLCFCGKQGWQEGIRFGLSSVIVIDVVLFFVQGFPKSIFKFSDAGAGY